MKSYILRLGPFHTEQILSSRFRTKLQVLEWNFSTNFEPATLAWLCPRSYDETESYVTMSIGLTPARTRVARVYARSPRGMRAGRRLRRASERAITLIRWIFRGIKGASVEEKEEPERGQLETGLWMECRVKNGKRGRELALDNWQIASGNVNEPRGRARAREISWMLRMRPLFIA